eukprot:12973549-Heterocapsa_arctica.AAC.1
MTRMAFGKLGDGEINSPHPTRHCCGGLLLRTRKLALRNNLRIRDKPHPTAQTARHPSSSASQPTTLLVFTRGWRRLALDPLARSREKHTRRLFA